MLNENQISIKIDSNISFQWSLIPNPNVDELIVERNNKLKIKNNPYYTLTRSIKLPYTSLQSKFKYKDALKLAEIDSIFKICPRSPSNSYIPSLLGYQFPQRIHTIDIGGGGFLEYIQFRYPQSITTGISEPRDSRNSNRFIRFLGEDFSGNFTTHWKSFLVMIQKQYVSGVDFASATFSSNDHMDFYTLIELFIISMSIKDGASAIIKMSGSWSSLMTETIYLSSQIFDEIYIHQPLVSGSDSDEIFLILKYASSERQDILSRLKNTLDDIPEDKYIYGFVSSSIPKSFINQIHMIRNRFLKKQIETLDNMEKLISNQSFTYDKIYDDIRIKLVEWALPDAY